VGGQASWLIQDEVCLSAGSGRTDLVSLPATSTDTHGHDPVLVGLSAFLMGLKGGRHIVVRYKRRVDQ
jgi:hypothetical protein